MRHKRLELIPKIVKCVIMFSKSIGTKIHILYTVYMYPYIISYK
jgi:hypothetical protein